MNRGGYSSLPEGWYAFDDNPQDFDPMISVWARGKEYPPTKIEHAILNPIDSYRQPTARELATGRVHNLFTLSDGLIGLMPVPI